jgi:hypothetical protein
MRRTNVNQPGAYDWWHGTDRERALLFAAEALVDTLDGVTTIGLASRCTCFSSRDSRSYSTGLGAMATTCWTARSSTTSSGTT